MSALAGTLYVAVDGVSYAVAGEGTYLVSSTDRTTLKGQDGVHGYSELPSEGHIAWKGRDSGSLSLTALNAAAGVTVVAELANGKTIIAANAWRDGAPAEVDTNDGTFSIRFASGDVSEN